MSGNCAAAVQIIPTDWTGECRGRHPADRHTGVVKDENPAVSCRGPGLCRGGAEAGSGLGREAQGWGGAEAERAVTPVASHEIRDEVIDRIGEEAFGRVDLREAAPDAQHGDLVTERDGLIDVMRDEEDRLG